MCVLSVCGVCVCSECVWCVCVLSVCVVCVWCVCVLSVCGVCVFWVCVLSVWCVNRSDLVSVAPLYVSLSIFSCLLGGGNTYEMDTNSPFLLLFPHFLSLSLCSCGLLLFSSRPTFIFTFSLFYFTVNGAVWRFQICSVSLYQPKSGKMKWQEVKVQTGRRHISLLLASDEAERGFFLYAPFISGWQTHLNRFGSGSCFQSVRLSQIWSQDSSVSQTQCVNSKRFWIKHWSVFGVLELNCPSQREEPETRNYCNHDKEGPLTIIKSNSDHSVCLNLTKPKPQRRHIRKRFHASV